MLLVPSALFTVSTVHVAVQLDHTCVPSEESERRRRAEFGRAVVSIVEGKTPEHIEDDEASSLLYAFYLTGGLLSIPLPGGNGSRCV